ncbi:MAG TPA: hypothetical protein VFA05_09265 [Gaiellaceae bacterium]|nr:hypothetical protein [Gaiellaceae bacterium]
MPERWLLDRKVEGRSLRVARSGRGYLVECDGFRARGRTLMPLLEDLFGRSSRIAVWLAIEALEADADQALTRDRDSAG